MHSLLGSALSPVEKHYKRDADMLAPILGSCAVTVLSSEEETALEFADAAAKYTSEPLRAGDKLLFASMGGSSTQVVCIDAEGVMHTASFAVGKNYFRRDGAAARGCIATMGRLLAFIGDTL